MHEPALEYTEKDGTTIKIYYDDDVENPYEVWDMASHIVSWHKRYTFDQHGPDEFGTLEDFHEWARINRAIMLPVYMLDHSGLTVSTSDSQFKACDPMAWDWGFLGYVYMDEEAIKREFGSIDLQALDGARKIMKQDIRTLDTYLTGDVLGYVKENEETGLDDSCWGFFGYDLEELLAEMSDEFEEDATTIEKRALRRALEVA